MKKKNIRKKNMIKSNQNLDKIFVNLYKDKSGD